MKRGGGRGGGRGAGGRGGRGGRGGGMKGGSRVVVEPHRHEGVFVAKGKEDALVTKNLVPGLAVYNEKRISVQVNVLLIVCLFVYALHCSFSYIDLFYSFERSILY